MIANGSLTKVGPFDPGLVDLVKAGKVPLMIGPTWFGEYVIKPTYEMAARQARRGPAAQVGRPGAAADLELGWWRLWRLEGHRASGRSRRPDHLDVERCRQPDHCRDPAGAPAVGDAWGERLKADAYYASPDVFDVQVEGGRVQPPGLHLAALLGRRRDRQDRRRPTRQGRDRRRPRCRRCRPNSSTSPSSTATPSSKASLLRLGVSPEAPGRPFPFDRLLLDQDERHRRHSIADSTA